LAHNVLESFREKYHRGSKRDKSRILDEVEKLLNCHRKHAVRVMKCLPPGRKPAPLRRGRKSKYDTPEFLRALHRMRRKMEFRNTEVMKENMPEWIPSL
jgi:hypothetical protein